MDALGFGPLIAWFRGILVDLLGAEAAPLALPLTYLLYAVLAVAALIPTRRWWRRIKDRWLLLHRPLRRIWRKFGMRKPMHALGLSTRLLNDTNVSVLSPLVGLVPSTLWFIAIRNALVPWQDSSFRTLVGQDVPNFLGAELGPGMNYASLEGLLLLVCTGLLVWFTSWSTFAQVRARLQRRAWLLQRFPARGTTLIPLGFVAAYLAFLYQLTVWVPSLPTVWATLILALIFIPVQLAARRQDKVRMGLSFRLPDWVITGPLPEPELAQPVQPAQPQIEPVVDSAPSAASPPLDATPYAPTEVMAGTPPVAPTRPWNGTTRPDNPQTRVMPTSWSALAPALEPLAAHEPRDLGPYTISGRIGSGGMAIVYLASSRRLPLIALKVANPLTTVQDVSKRLMSEITTLSKVTDPAVVRIHDAGIIDEHPFLAMTYLKGPALHQAVTTLGPLCDQDALRALGASMASGLAAIHAVGVHRDLKPANVILTDGGPVIVDLGIAKLRGATTDLTREGTALGTIGYTPPEVLRGEIATPAADVFAWGACIAYAASGRALFTGDTLAAQLEAVRTGRGDPAVVDTLEAIDPVLASIVRRCTDPDPNARPTDGRAIVRALPKGARWPEPAGAVA